MELYGRHLEDKQIKILNKLNFHRIDLKSTIRFRIDVIQEGEEQFLN